MEERGAFLLPGWVTLILFAGVVASELFWGDGEVLVCRVLGIACLALAAVFIFIPFYQLKKFGNVPAGRSYMDTRVVVDRGLYAIVRHPQYLGYILLFGGFFCLTQNGISLVLAALGILTIVLHTLEEERECLERFGANYAAYRRRVPLFNFLLGTIQYLRLSAPEKELPSGNGPPPSRREPDRTP